MLRANYPRKSSSIRPTARRLACPVGTVESRLSRGRQRLRDRLVRRGLAPAAAAVWAETAREASASIPAALIKHITDLKEHEAIAKSRMELARGT
jgi:hypothetical protein